MQVLELLVECPMFRKVCDKQLPQSKCFGSCLSFMHHHKKILCPSAQSPFVDSFNMTLLTPAT